MSIANMKYNLFDRRCNRTNNTDQKEPVWQSWNDLFGLQTVDFYTDVCSCVCGRVSFEISRYMAFKPVLTRAICYVDVAGFSEICEI